MTNEIMTVEEAIEKLKSKMDGHTDTSYEWVETVRMAIKALEQMLILDKIRAEIENHCGLLKVNHCRYCSYCNNLMGVREILQIIDKYIEGSENE